MCCMERAAVEAIVVEVLGEHSEEHCCARARVAAPRMAQPCAKHHNCPSKALHTNCLSS